MSVLWSRIAATVCIVVFVVGGVGGAYLIKKSLASGSGSHVTNGGSDVVGTN